jgi:hypothetical protein
MGGLHYHQAASSCWHADGKHAVVSNDPFTGECVDGCGTGAPDMYRDRFRSGRRESQNRPAIGGTQDAPHARQAVGGTWCIEQWCRSGRAGDSRDEVSKAIG